MAELMAHEARYGGRLYHKIRCPNCYESTTYFEFAKLVNCSFCGAALAVPKINRKTLALSDRAKIKAGIVGPPPHYKGCECKTCVDAAIREAVAEEGKLRCKKSDKARAKRLAKMNANPFKKKDYKICCSVARRAPEHSRHPPTSCPYRHRKKKREATEGLGGLTRPKAGAQDPDDFIGGKLPKKKGFTSEELAAKRRSEWQKQKVSSFYDGYKLNAVGRMGVSDLDHELFHRGVGMARGGGGQLPPI